MDANEIRTPVTHILEEIPEESIGRKVEAVTKTGAAVVGDLLRASTLGVVIRHEKTGGTCYIAGDWIATLLVMDGAGLVTAGPNAIANLRPVGRA